ncbi:MAG: HAE1 family hydrophobic/amphiphilic exporter-1 [bacterium]
MQHNVHIGNPEIQIIYKREQLNFYNLQIKDVAEIVRAKVLGEVPTTFKGFGEQIDILVKLSTKNLQTISSLNNLVINPNQKNPIRLSQVANIHIGQGPSEIRRNQQQRTGIITARVRGIDILTATTIIENKLAKMKFPNGFFYFVKGQNKEMESSRKSMIFALLLAIFLVYIVMASQFESFLQPFIIIFSIPFALSGVILGLMITNQSINVLVFIGLIMLAGIVVNNAIVLVDSINQLQTSGLDKIEAIIQAGRSRLRPILMTSLTTALGLLPMALGIGEGAEMRTPLAITVISGLLSSTLLSLVVIPLIYQVIIREKRPKEEQLVKE